ncbi:hypothetical protein B0H63DRAFT_560273 [Podospora didyma]|uniref:F-box domain-containing protein n=1 Tax=Podospora didyma TaxID=330526 RepID=A0AAE0NQC4_9PEZI|nr:hypothetical protein B0H63DRAFT_560273 [Podospora didyma]
MAAFVDPTDADTVRAWLTAPVEPPHVATLGWLDFPLELHFIVLRHLDIASLSALGQVNRRARAAVTAMPEFNQVVTHAIEVLGAVLRTCMASRFTIVQLNDVLHTAKCQNYIRSGFLLFLPKLSRLCFDCLTAMDQPIVFVMLTPEMAHKWTEDSYGQESWNEAGAAELAAVEDKDPTISVARHSGTRLYRLSALQSAIRAGHLPKLRFVRQPSLAVNTQPRPSTSDTREDSDIDRSDMDDYDTDDVYYTTDDSGNSDDSCAEYTGGIRDPEMGALPLPNHPKTAANEVFHHIFATTLHSAMTATPLPFIDRPRPGTLEAQHGLCCRGCEIVALRFGLSPITDRWDLFLHRFYSHEESMAHFKRCSEARSLLADGWPADVRRRRQTLRDGEEGEEEEDGDVDHEHICSQPLLRGIAEFVPA